VWTDELDDEFEELMEDYPLVEPTIERVVRFEDRLDRIEAALKLRETEEGNV